MEIQSQLRTVRFGLVFGLVAVLYGWGLGVYFGVGEEALREGFIREAHAHRDVYAAKNQTDEAIEAAIKRIDQSAWTYFQRAHLHAGGIGSIAIAASMLLAFLSAAPVLRLVASTLLGLGSIGYPLFWMFAGLRAPSLGSTGLAKESLGWLAIPSASALVIGAVLTLGLVVSELLLRRGTSTSR